MGIGKIGGSAMEAIARQPEASGDIRMNMIIAAALIEGVALLAVLYRGDWVLGSLWITRARRIPG